MPTPVTAVHVLRMLLQMEHNLSGLQRDMRDNAATWKIAAQQQTPSVATIAGWMNTAATSYNARLGWVAAAKADSVNWAKVVAMWVALGGTDADYTNLTTPIAAVATQLGPAPKTTFAQIIGICDQITTAISAPMSLWPE